jgi:aryl-alcohol dehydrogenase-like predicted oxidoreductase
MIAMPSVFPLRHLGNTDLRVSPIGLGCWQFSQGKGLFGSYWAVLPQEEIEAIVRAALEGGIDWFDTAESYGGGASERALAAALKSLGRAPADVVVATKWMPVLRRSRSIGETIGRRLESLGGFRIDLHQIHNPLSVSGLKAQIEGMAALAETGKIRYVGVSNFSAKRMVRAHALLAGRGRPLASNQVHYSLLHRKIESSGVLDEAKRLGISVIAYSPLEQGILTGRFHADPAQIRTLSGVRRNRSAFRPRGLDRSRPVIDALREIGARHAATPAQVALNWLVTFHGETVVAIPGATRAAQAKDNAGAMSFRLTKDELDHLDKASAAFK